MMGQVHLLRSYVFTDLLQRGDWFPRWAPDLYLGYGYPVFNYVPPLPYYLAALGHLLGLDRYGGLQAVGVIAVLQGAIGAFSLARALWHRPVRPAFWRPWRTSSLPYPFLYNLYIRGNVPEALALGLLPWLLWAAWRLWHEPRWPQSLLLALLTALLLLTHSITAFFSAGLLLVWVFSLLLSGTSGASKVRVALGATLGASLAGLALSAYFWLPALGEREFVHIKYFHQGFHLLHTWLFDPLGAVSGSQWPDYTGTPVSARLPCAGPPVFSSWIAGPHKPLLPQLVLLTGLVGGLVAAIRRHDRRNLCLLACCGLVTVGCWFLLTTWSAAIWPHLLLLRDIQFPWRLYGPADLMLALGAAGGVWAAMAGPGGASEPRAHCWSWRPCAASSLGRPSGGWLRGHGRRSASPAGAWGRPSCGRRKWGSRRMEPLT